MIPEPCVVGSQFRGGFLGVPRSGCFPVCLHPEAPPWVNFGTLPPSHFGGTTALPPPLPPPPMSHRTACSPPAPRAAATPPSSTAPAWAPTHCRTARTGGGPPPAPPPHASPRPPLPPPSHPLMPPTPLFLSPSLPAPTCRPSPAAPPAPTAPPRPRQHPKSTAAPSDANCEGSRPRQGPPRGAHLGLMGGGCGAGGGGWGGWEAPIWWPRALWVLLGWRCPLPVLKLPGVTPQLHGSPHNAAAPNVTSEPPPDLPPHPN